MATASKFWVSNPVGGDEIMRTRPDLPWGPSILLYNWYRTSLLGAERLGGGVGHPPPSSADVKERIELYFSSGPSQPVLV
jgi:hypothetical protein